MFNSPKFNLKKMSLTAKPRSVWLKSIYLSLFGAALMISMPAQADMMKKYNAACAACHQAGALGSPKTGDKATWGALMKKGMPTLVASVKNGKNNMPARGLCDDCTDAELEAIITFMSK